MHEISLHWGSYSKISSPAKEAMKKSEEQFLMPGDVSGVLRAARAIGLQIQEGIDRAGGEPRAGQARTRDWMKAQTKLLWKNALLICCGLLLYGTVKFSHTS